MRFFAGVAALRLMMELACGQHWTTTPPRFPFTAPVSSYSLTNALGGLQFTGAVGLAVPPGQTNSLFITRKQGRIDVVTNLATPTATLFLDLTASTFTASEGGLTGLAFHPNYQQNGSFFVFYTRTNAGSGQMHNVISRFQTDPANPWRALTQSEQVLIAARDYNDTHQGGDLHFGPDGYLYVSLGDGGGSWGQFTNSQRIDLDLFGGILRLDVDGRPGSLPPNPHVSVQEGYWIPGDNPFIGATSFGGQAVSPGSVRTEFWAVGLRNPFRMSFDSVTGFLYAGDVGNNTVEEINRIVAGGNFGWNRFEGTDQKTGLPPGVTYLPPLHEYRHTSQSTGNPEFLGDCVVGGIVYRGLRHPELYGKYVFGDYMTRHIWAMNPAGTGLVRLMTAGTPFVCFFNHPGTDELLVVERSGTTVGRVSKLVRTTQSGATPLPATLSQTGVFTDLATLATQEGILPYEVNAPFWSDHAEKLRWFFLQDPASAITRDAADQWTLPTGAVWVKHFEMEMTRGNPATRKRLETRFLVKTADSVYGLTYRWRADGSNADLVGDSGQSETLLILDGGVTRTQVWHYPGRSECLVCHTTTDGGALGFSTRQLNRNVTVSGVAINQLTALGNLDVFSPPHGSPASLPRLASPADATASLEFRFRSYLDVNCAYCHQPDGLGRGTWDGRLSTPLAQAGILDGGVIDDLGIFGARVIAPGNLDSSVLWHRVSALGSQHMPPLATSALNTAGIELVRHYTLFASEGPLRTLWQIGSDDPASVPASSRHLEFSMQNGSGNAVPGEVTRVPGDPEFPANPAINPVADDDFYFAGAYPPGFNGLTLGRSVPFDEPAGAWERGHTAGDRTNRIHFVLDPAHIGSGRAFRFTAEFASGGYSINDVIQSVFGDHDMVVRFRNGSGNSVVLRSQRISQPSTLVVEFTAAAAGATAGPNTIEIIRTGPNLSNGAHWIRYDHARIESIGESNFAPTLAQPASQTIPESALHQSQ
ncbi:MAG: PQQ-dependent sugar dehydrogenase, partial [Verrucomicrobia bacterium]|nr:PQQ-dependent sugar dehydrogenase [Verrucomicrobiota bacterium]